MTLISEIHEQADVLARLLDNQWAVVQKIAATVREADPDYVFLAARGTSDNAGRYANYVWGSLNGLPVALATPSLFSLYRRPPRLKGALVVGISQSGQSPDIVSVLAEARRQGSPTLAIVNAPNSPLAGAADWVIDIQAGDEKAVAATKTYTAELMAVAMLAAALANSAEMHAELRQVPEWISSVLERADETIRLAERFRFMERCVVLGRGYNYASAFEWSLKLKELSYITAEPYSSADFQHGPIAVVEHGFPVLAIAPSGVVYPGLLELFQQLRREHAAELAIISDRAEALELAQSPMRLPEGMPEWLSPLTAIVPGQLFAYGLTQVKGFSTETPRSIRKVTETH